MKPLDEKTIQFVENQIPELAGQATHQAFWHSLSSGDTVLVSQEGQLWEVFPDGHRQYVKDLTGPTTVQQRSFTISPRPVSAA